MSENFENDSEKTDHTANAVSIFGQSSGSVDEFPVLKAFQQYIDAEQAKARKRMLGLSVFFIVLMVLVVAIFAMILMTLLQRNQQQSDRLLEIALRERQVPHAPVAPVVVNQPTSQQDTLKPVLEQLANLTTAIKESSKPVQQPVQVQAAPIPSTPAQDEMQRRLDAEMRKLAEARAQLKAEQEQARREEVERQRRRLYPEYYEKQDRAAAAAAAAERALQQQANPAPLPNPVYAAPVQTQPVYAPQPATPPVAPAPVAASDAAHPNPASVPSATSRSPAPTGSNAAPDGTVDYVLPVGTRKTKGVKWRVPIPE